MADNVADNGAAAANRAADREASPAQLKVNTALSLKRTPIAFDRAALRCTAFARDFGRRMSFRNMRRRQPEDEQGECQRRCPVLTQSHRGLALNILNAG